jgi:MGT family glycosyltransferase
MSEQRFLLCTTPAQGHTAPLLALSRRLVGDGHAVTCFTTEHYRDKVASTGAGFVPFRPEYDAHDLMVANPERESSSKRGIRGLKDDLRRIFLGTIPGQFADLNALRQQILPHVIVVDTMFFGALPLALGPRAERPALACVGVMPFPAMSRDTATFGPALQPGTRSIHRLRNVVMNWATEHVALRDIQRLTQDCVARCGAPPFRGYFMNQPSQVADVFFQATVAGFEYPRSDLPPTVRFVGPILSPPSSSFDAPAWWPELDAGRPVVHVTQGTLDNADLGRLLIPTMRALADHDVLVVATTGGPDPEPLRRDLPANVRLERFIPHDLLLPHVDVMVTNGGYGGVQQALANGVPLVVAGDSEDKPEVAARVRWSGTGIDLRTGKPSPAKIARAVQRVLATPSFADRARSLQQSIAQCDPLTTIAQALVELSDSGAAGSAGGSAGDPETYKSTGDMSA